MERYFTADYRLLWALALALALFYPLRQLIWVLYVRRAERKEGKVADEQRQALKRRAAVTAALLGLVFSYFYTLNLF